MRLKSDLLLLLTATIWGTAFVAQRLVASNATLGVFLFNGLRFIIGALVLLPFIYRSRPERRSLPWMAAAGVILVGGAGLQQAGMISTTAANAGFITTFYVVLVPLILTLFLREKIGWIIWLAGGMAVIGGLCLSGGGLTPFVFGDLLELLGAGFWALHVVLVGRKANNYNPLWFAFGQFVVAGLINLVIGLLFESQTLSGLPQSWMALLYVGVFSNGIAYTLQVIAQRKAPPADAAIILSLESVMAALAGYFILKESLFPIQIVGCALIFSAALLTQIPFTRQEASVEPVPE
jgi:drug/metabolite transporter (DMT)-like permease